MNILKYLHLLTLIVWLGGMILFSFVVTPSIFKILTREMAGTMVGNLFPKYFFIGYIASLFLLVTLWLIAHDYLHAVRVPFAILIVATALTFVSGMGVGARAREAKAQMYAEQDVTKKEELRKEFGKVHAVSTILNVAIMLLLLGYVWYVPAVLYPKDIQQARL